MQEAERIVNEEFERWLEECQKVKCDEDQDREIEKELQREKKEERRLWREREKLGYR